MTGRSFEADLHSEIRELIERGTFGSPLAGAWIYGSRALSPELRDSDTDLLVVLRDCRQPSRVELLKHNGSPISVNVVGIESFSAHHIIQNGGFYFTGKLLGPRYLLIGDVEECRSLLVRAYANMLYPWATYMIPAPTMVSSLSVDQLLALLFLLLIRIGFSYLSYFTRWYFDPQFPRLWKETTDLLKDVASLPAQATQSQFEIDSKPTLFKPEKITSADQKRVLLQYLSSCFWLTFSRHRPNACASLEAYFDKQVQAFGRLEPESSRKALDFLREKLEVELLS